MKNTCRILAFSLCASLLFAVCGTARAATYAKKLDITAAGVPENVTLTDFPLLVRLSESIDGFSYQDFLGTGGSDIRFEDASGNPLAYDVDTWNELGESLVWVKVPSLAKGNVLTMRYGSAAPDANDPTNVWSNYVGVWHGNQYDANHSSADSTYYGRLATPSADGFTVSNVRADHLGSAWYNNRTDGTYPKKIKIPLGTVSDSPLSDLTSISRFAVSAWVKSAAEQPDFRLFSSKESAEKKGFEFMVIKSGAKIMLRGDGNSKTLSWTGGYGTVGSMNWTHMACSFDGTAGTVYVNGTTSSSTLDAPTSHAGISAGNYSPGSGNEYGPFTGYMDEIRIYNGVPSDEYLKAEYAQVVTSGYVSFGSVENAAADIAEISAAPTVVRNGDGTYTISATVSGVAGKQYDIDVLLGDTVKYSTTWTAAEGATAYNVSWTTDNSVANGTYSASVRATAPSGAVVSRPAADVFLVGDVSAAAGADAYEQGLVSGSFTLSRPGDAALPLAVFYSVSSEAATANVSYRAFSGTATFEAGSSTATVVAEPFSDITLRADATLTLTISVGDFYGVSQNAGTASITLVDYAVPDGYNVWIARNDGNASAASNWSLGHAPTAEDEILLGAWSSRNLTWDALATRSVTSWTQNSDYNGLVSFPITYEGADGDQGFNVFTISNDVQILGGVWVHPVQGRSSTTSTAPAEKYRIAVSAGGDFTVGTGVKVSAQGRGRGFWTQSDEGKRGIHAGYVISSTNDMYSAVADALYLPYGSILEPVATGKGATSGTDSATDWGIGGGAIHLVVGGALVNNGEITANGQSATSKTGGSGGSIYIRAASISGTGTFTADATCSAGSGSPSANSGGRVSLVATGVNSASAANASASGSRSPDQWQYNNQPYYEGAAGTVWLESSSAKTLLIRNAHPHAAYIRAYTPIPADDAAATARAAFAPATLKASDNARVRVESNLRFDTLEVQTNVATCAHVDLFGNILKVSRIVGTNGNVIVSHGTYALADALSRGWTWFEDSSAVLNEEGTAVATPGTGAIQVGQDPLVIIIR